MKHDVLEDRLLDYLYDEMSSDERVEYERELEQHPDIAARVRSYEGIRAAARAVEPPSPSEQALRNIMREARQHAVDLADAHERQRGLGGFFGRLSAFLMQPAVATALVFAVVLVTGALLLREGGNQDLFGGSAEPASPTEVSLAPEAPAVVAAPPALEESVPATATTEIPPPTTGTAPAAMKSGLKSAPIDGSLGGKQRGLSVANDAPEDLADAEEVAAGEPLETRPAPDPTREAASDTAVPLDDRTPNELAAGLFARESADRGAAKAEEAREAEEAGPVTAQKGKLDVRDGLGQTASGERAATASGQETLALAKESDAPPTDRRARRVSKKATGKAAKRSLADDEAPRSGGAAGRVGAVGGAADGDAFADGATGAAPWKAPAGAAEYDAPRRPAARPTETPAGPEAAALVHGEPRPFPQTQTTRERGEPERTVSVQTVADDALPNADFEPQEQVRPPAPKAEPAQGSPAPAAPAPVPASLDSTDLLDQLQEKREKKDEAEKPAQKAAEKPSTTPPPSPESQANEAFRTADAAFEARRFADAAEAFRRYLGFDRSSARGGVALIRLGQSYQALGRYREALDAYEEALRRHPRYQLDPAVLFQAASLQVKLGKLGAAEGNLVRIESDPTWGTRAKELLDVVRSRDASKEERAEPKKATKTRRADAPKAKPAAKQAEDAVPAEAVE